MTYESQNSVSFPVWVGLLSESVSESILLSHFKKFGPVRNVVIVKDPATKKSKLFGYVNYHNHEVAEVAAQEMNDVEICGRKIKTKGPKKLHSFSPPASPDKKKKDVRSRSLTDCFFYITTGDCTPKEGQTCQYRHFERARLTKEICEKWSDRSCAKKNCAKRHPGQMPGKGATKIVGDVSLDRCNSHNAYKCYSQCGQKECNTHFQTEQDLIDHVIEGKQALLPCEICNAVFFNKEEKLNHTHNIRRTPDFLDSSSSCSSQSTTHSNTEPIGVFWDIENCRVPRGKSAIAVVNKIREKFYPGRREVEFMCVCDTTKEKKEILEELNKAQINIVHINATSKNAADDKLKQALRRFAQAHLPPATIVLVSGDINFASELSDLRHRHNLQVILIHNKQASDALLNCANECECFDAFTTGLPACTAQVAESTEVLITNLPSSSKHSVHKVKGRLNTLACNTGGKVISISPFDELSKDNIAVLRFPDVDSACRGVQRLNKETVFGSEINATFYNPKKKMNKDDSIVNKMSKSKSNPNLQKTDNSSNYKVAKNKKNAVQNEKENNNDDIHNTSHITMTFIEEKNIKTQNKVPVNKEQFSNGILPLHSIDLSLAKTRPTNCKSNMSPQLPTGHSSFPSFSWSQVTHNLVQGSLHSSSTNGIDLLVTNIDESVSVKELKRKLSSLVREHSKVVSVIIAGHGKENNLHAFIKVPKLQDAQLCVSKLNNQILFNRRIHVTFASAKENAILKMKSEATSVLLETYAGWLPMNDFLSSYKDRFQHAFHVLNFDQIKDLVYVDGCPGFQFVCLLHFPVGLLKVKQEKGFDKEVADVLKSHNRRVPFASVPGLYWSYMKKFIPICESGELLVKAVVLNKNLCLCGSYPVQQAIFYKVQRPEKGEKMSLNIFKTDLVRLLKVSPGFSITLNKFIPLYHQFFGRQCCVVDYGVKDLAELLSKLSDAIEVSGLADSRAISLTAAFREKLLEDDLKLLLLSREKQKMPISSLITAYFRFYGHKMYFRNFGFNSLGSLVLSLDAEQFKVSGTGDGKVLVLCKEKRKSKQNSLKVFANEVASLIQNQPDKKLGLHNLSSEYYKHYGKQLKLADLGFAKLSDLVSAVSDFVEISGSRDQKTLYISDEHPNFDKLWSDVQILLGYSIEKAILVLLLPDVYKERFKQNFPLDNVKLNHFFKKLPANVVSIGKGSHRIIFDINPEEYPYKLLVDHVIDLLHGRDHFKSTMQELSQLLFSSRKISISAAQLQSELVNNEYFQVTKSGTAQLTHATARKLFEYEVVTIINEQPKKQAFVQQIVKHYSKKYSKVLRLADYGVQKMQILFEKLTPGMVQLNFMHSQLCVTLGVLGTLYSECKSVLEENDGSLLLCNFAPEYQRLYNKPLKASEFGFAKVGDLVECLSGVLKVYGEKNMKVVVLKEALLNPPAVDFESEKISFDGDSDSDVVVESEEYENETVFSKTDDAADNQDLLQFAEAEKQCEDLFEWWMEPVPDLPQPALEPELHQALPSPSFDLISFTEFDGGDVRNGGLDDHTLSRKSPVNPFSRSQQVSKDPESDNFVDNMFNDELSSQQEPDLMRMLLGRCSPVGGFPLSSPLVAEAQSSTNDSGMSGVSETYSCFSALERAKATHGPYSTTLHDVFSNQLTDGSVNKSIRPKIAANFKNS